MACSRLWLLGRRRSRAHRAWADGRAPRRWLCRRGRTAAPPDAARHHVSCNICAAFSWRTGCRGLTHASVRCWHRRLGTTVPATPRRAGLCRATSAQQHAELEMKTRSEPSYPDVLVVTENAMRAEHGRVIGAPGQDRPRLERALRQCPRLPIGSRKTPLREAQRTR